MSATTTMDATEVFFNDLSQRRHDPLLERVTGTFCFELVQGERQDTYLLTVNKGDMVVSHERGEPDCTVRTDRALFNRILLGEASMLAAALRGELTFRGDPELIAQLFQRLICRANEVVQNRPGLAGGERGRR